jgi:nucleoside phosphorylase
VVPGEVVLAAELVAHDHSVLAQDNRESGSPAEMSERVER